MKLNLNPLAVNFYWKTLDVKFSQFLKKVSEVETWTLTDNPTFQSKLREFVLVYKESPSQNYSANSEKIIQLMMYMNIAQAAYFLHFLDKNFPGLSFHYVMLSRHKEDWEPAKLLLERLQIIKDFNYLKNVFNSSRIRLISGLLKNDQEIDECERN